MQKFDFITVEEFRHSLQSDYEEMNRCIEAQAWKSVHTLAGSIVEALLVDYLLDEELVPENEALRMTLDSAITKCREKGIISEQSEKLSTVIKGYRNLIHPGRTVRLQQKVNRKTAQVAQALTDIVIDEIESLRNAKFGYTAAQVVSKVLGDSSAEFVLPSLLRSMRRSELERLIVDILPRTVAEQAESSPYRTADLQRLSKCYRAAFEIADDNIRRKATEGFAKLMREATGYLVRIHTRYLFRASDMGYLADEDAESVKQYLLGSLDSDMDVDLLIALDGIGRFLQWSDAWPFARLVIGAVFERRRVTDAILSLWRNTLDSVGQNERDELGRLINVNEGIQRSNGRIDLADELAKLNPLHPRETHISDEDIPF